jgi:integrase
MGVAVQGCRPKLPNKLKWWLTPRQQEAMRAMLGADDPLMQFADWTLLTGLRVEETLRLTRDSFNEDFTEVNVPGLKTVAAQATLPLSSAATVVAVYVFKGRNRGLMFHTVNYCQLMRKWARVRKQMGIENPGATLKAFRRGAARQLTVGGMPLDMLRQYLRHESVRTTMGYLRLVGGYDKDEMRKFLK